jgi:hypothetical protein
VPLIIAPSADAAAAALPALRVHAHGAGRRVESPRKVSVMVEERSATPVPVAEIPRAVLAARQSQLGFCRRGNTCAACSAPNSFVISTRIRVPLKGVASRGRGCLAARTRWLHRWGVRRHVAMSARRWRGADEVRVAELQRGATDVRRTYIEAVASAAAQSRRSCCPCGAHARRETEQLRGGGPGYSRR